jgi:hypothetical protein
MSHGKPLAIIATPKSHISSANRQSASEQIISHEGRKKKT